MLFLLPWLGMDAEAIAQTPDPEQKEDIEPHWGLDVEDDIMKVSILLGFCSKKLIK